MHVERKITTELLVSVGEIITALKRGGDVGIDIQSLPDTGTNVMVTLTGDRGIKLTHTRVTGVNA